MTRFATPGYSNLRFEYSLTETDSKVTDALAWQFAIAETIQHLTTSEVPAHWEFRDSPVHTDDNYNDDDLYEESILQDLHMNGDFTDDDLINFGDVLDRYLNVLRQAGLEY